VSDHAGLVPGGVRNIRRRCRISRKPLFIVRPPWLSRHRDPPAVFALAWAWSWVFLSDVALSASRTNRVLIARVETAKGWIFILAWPALLL